MQTDNDLEQRLRSVLRQTLDHETGPDPAWDESPASRRVAEQDRRRPSRWTVRLLAIAALITIGVGSALLLGAPDDGPAQNGWIAYGFAEEGPAPDYVTIGEPDIWFVSLDSEPRRVIGTDTDVVDQVCPAFSPDGRSLAYGEADQSGATPTTAVVVAAVSATGEVSDVFRADVPGAPPCPVWSPAGDRVAFGVPQTSPVNPTQSAEGSEVWIVTVADRGITVLPDLLATDLEFSPDGSLLAVASGMVAPPADGEKLPDGQIHVYDLASGTTRTLDTTVGAVTFTWSPDGERIAYETGDADHELRVIDLATEDQRVLAVDYSAIHGIGPVWSPNGDTIVYQRCPGSFCNGERHEVVVVWPDDLSDAGMPREEIIPLFEAGGDTDGSDLSLTPYWVTWSPDGQYLLFMGWSSLTDPLLGAVRAVPGSASDILVALQDVLAYPANDGGPSVPIQSWGRLPADAAMPTPTPEVSAAGPTPSPSPPVSLPTGPHLLREATDNGVPVTVTIAAPLWNGEPNGGYLCWRDPADRCSDPPDGAGIFAFEGREYRVYADACHRDPSPRPDNVATTVDELVVALAQQYHRGGSSPEDISVGGYAGKRIVLAMGFDPGDCNDGTFALFGLAGDDLARHSQGPGQIEEVWAVDVDGLLVVLDGAYYADTPQNVVDEVRAILASATFE